ncbi:S-adenosyl-L-methionine-dependent methyltransferase [Spinellus fusiger]|nr:S-adenosyl-L-methionine-dependent methyltransferase [Spinellus fusiger]
MLPFTVRAKYYPKPKTASSNSSRIVHEKASSASQAEEEPVLEPKFNLGQYEYIEGRNYLQAGNPASQLMPCDDEEVERLELTHVLFKLLFGKSHFAPIEEQLRKGIQVLETGAGPGWWIHEKATEYPNSHFTGVEVMLYPTNPPNNTHYRIVDITKGLPFPDNYFDYVVQRDSMYHYTREDWDTVLSEIIRVTKPNGYIELLENSGVLNDIGPNMSVWMMRWTVSLQTRKINPRLGNQLSQLLMTTEKVKDLESSHRSLPIGWLGKLGDTALECYERLFDSVKPRLCEDWSMSTAKYDKLAKAASKECRDFKSWTNVFYVYCQKKTLQELEQENANSRTVLAQTSPLISTEPSATSP